MAKRAGQPKQWKAGDDLKYDLGSGVQLEMVWISPGQFAMGGSGGEYGEEQAHSVQFERGFWIGKHPITVAQYCAVVGSDSVKLSVTDRPMRQVTWLDAKSFCTTLERMLDIPGVVFRLPSEAEWEYCCRAGQEGKWCCGCDESLLGDYAWHSGNSRAVQPVGRKLPNTWGLHDMHGNVLEWCEDTYQHSYDGAPCDGRPWIREYDVRVVRGGSWRNSAEWCGSAFRNGIGDWGRLDDLGFRVLGGGAQVK